ncbi:MAG: hypothetical protein ACRD2O_16140 [Terriglobia bacterium]
MRIKGSLFTLVALPAIAALAIGSTPTNAPIGKTTTSALPMLTQNPEPPEIIVPRPRSLPGDFEDQHPRDQGSKASRFDPVKARKDAQQLADLAQKIPPEINQLSKDQIPKDLLQNLKQIQKLAKRLRSEIPH